MTIFNVSEEKWSAAIDKVLLQMKEENERFKKASDAFLVSDKFTHILECIKRTPVVFEEEGFRYFPEQTAKTFGFDGVAEEEINLFIECLTSKTDNKQVQPEDPENPFAHTYIHFTDLDLWLFVMWGQGCLIQIAGFDFR